MLKAIMVATLLSIVGCSSAGINDPGRAKRMIDSQCAKNVEQRALDRAIMDSRTMPTGVIRLYCGTEMKHIGL